MFKKVIYYLIFICLAGLVSLLQVSFVGSFPFRLNLLLGLMIVFVCLSYSPGLSWLFLAGILVDFYSAGPFGIFTAALLISGLVVYWLKRQMFAEQSFLSLSLIGAIGILVYQAVIFLTNHLFYFLKLSNLAMRIDRGYLFVSAKAIFFNLLFVLLLFFLSNLANRFFKRKFVIQH